MIAAMNLFAFGTSGLSMGDIFTWVVIFAALIAITLVAVKATGVQIPPWLIHIIIIIAIAFVAILAIKIVLSM